MNAVIMAGGEGTRLKSVTGDTPKPMALLCGRPLLEHILALLRHCGIKRVCISLHYRPEVIMAHIGDGSAFGLSVTYSVESRALGTAGGVKACGQLLGRGDVLVMSGDCACDFDLRTLIEAHRRHQPALTLALAPRRSPLQYGVVLTDPSGHVVSFTEKPAWDRVLSDTVNTGIYVVSPQALELIPPDRPFDFSRDLFPKLLQTEAGINAFSPAGYWCDIGTPRAYFRCNLDALDGKLKLFLPSTAPAPAAPTRTAPAPGVSAGLYELPCSDRAKAMRLISQALMEAGADFSCGLSVPSPAGPVRIHPSDSADSICIDTGRNDKSGALAQKYAALIRALPDFHEIG